MSMNWLLVLLSTLSVGQAHNEIGADLLANYQQGLWFVKFYAPWCGYCKQLAPIWDSLEKELFDTGINVVRVDATAYPDVASEFDVTGYPTIVFIKEGAVNKYSGPRTLEDLKLFARRLRGPSVKTLGSLGEWNRARRENSPMYVWVGDAAPPEDFLTVAEKLQSKTEFFTSLYKVLPSDIKVKENVIMVIKSPDVWDVYSGEVVLEELLIWCTVERFPAFAEVAVENLSERFHPSVSQHRLHAIAFVGGASSEATHVENWVKAIAMKSDYRTHFIFSFSRDSSLFKDLTLISFEGPTLAVVNGSNDHFWLPEEESSKLSQGILMRFLDSIRNDQNPPQGGYSWGRKFKRTLHEITKAISSLFSVGVVIALLVIAVPLTVVGCLCYLMCTMDMGDDTGGDEDSEEETTENVNRRLTEEQVEGLRQRRIRDD